MRVPNTHSQHARGIAAGFGVPPYRLAWLQACDSNPHSEPAVGMLDSGRVESTGLVGFDQTPIVLNDSLRLRVPTDRLRRNC